MGRVSARLDRYRGRLAALFLWKNEVLMAACFYTEAIFLNLNNTLGEIAQLKTTLLDAHAKLESLVQRLQAES